MENQYKGVVIFDFLLSIIPLVLLLSFIINYSLTMSERSLDIYKKQVVFDKLVSVADYLVKREVAAENGELFGEKRIYPNKIDEGKLALLNVERIREEIGLNRLTVGFSKSADTTCVYRIVVDGRNEIRKFYVCGE